MDFGLGVGFVDANVNVKQSNAMHDAMLSIAQHCAKCMLNTCVSCACNMERIGFDPALIALVRAEAISKEQERREYRAIFDDCEKPMAIFGIVGIVLAFAIVFMYEGGVFG